MLTQNGFANRESNILEQALNLFWYSAWFAIPMSIGCDWNSKIGVERKLPKGETTSSSPTFSVSAEKISGQNDNSIRTVTLEIVVSGFSNSGGSCRIAVYLSQSHFNDPEYAIAKESVGILDLKASWQVQVAIPVQTNRDIESTTLLAVSAYHDENDNSRLDKSSFGIPTERYGFSKNPERGFGPPKFSETAIELSWTKQSSDLNVTLEVPIQIK